MIVILFTITVPSYGKEHEILEYINAFPFEDKFMLNPSIAEYDENRYIGLSRVKTSTYKRLFITDKNFNILSTKEYRPKKRFIDEFIIKHNNQLYVIYNNKVPCNDGNSFTRKMCISKLDPDRSDPIFDHHIVSYDPDGNDRQKNWMPFTFDDRFFLVHTISPHLVVELDLNTYKIINSYHTENTEIREHWKNDPHGGTPPLYLPEMDCFVTFFQAHSYQTKSLTAWADKWPQYKVGAYLFESKPPFKVIAYTPEHLTYPGLYAPDPENGFKVVFPRGLVRQDEDLVISIGIDEYRGELVKVNKQALIDSMIYVDR